MQQAAIPLGRFGADLIVQAKAGTGKTVTFGVVALDVAQGDLPGPQVLVVEPTREVALQVQRTLGALGKELGLACAAFVGGLPTHADALRLRSPCHLAVGTPGRLCALVQDGLLRLEHVRLLVLDEADTLLAGGFVADLATLLAALPARKQVLAFSATFTGALLGQLRQLMSQPQEVLLCPLTVTLRGVRQLYAEVPAGGSVLAAKEVALARLLTTVAFNQALVFCNARTWAEALAARLTRHGFPAAFTCGSLPQRRRMEVMDSMRSFRTRVLVSTDLSARGLDLSVVNLVVSIDQPASDATYLHRVGRTGRFGTSGVHVSLVTPEELATLQAVVARANGELAQLPAEIPPGWYAASLPIVQQTAMRELRAARSRAEQCVEERHAPQVDHAELDEGADEETCMAWAEWQQRQAFFSFVWHQAARGQQKCRPWAVPPVPVF